ncbi:LacI family DNA-binding transcriptional regulator [Cereibacter sphaeroides]|uniref:LacI family DNA-binding transcriptional regulator n=1 Tax=Cereibacter sphaeroides TaxID=1063 RepID=UPI003990C6B9
MARAGIREIAALAGVSEATVDRVLHGRPNVRPGTAERVLRAAADCRYLSPAELARLERRDRKRLTVLLPKSANPFIRGLNRELREWAQRRDRGARIHSYLLDAMNPETTARSLRRLGRTSDAMAFFGVDHPDVRDEVDRLVDQGKLVLTLISDITGSRRHGCIGIDNLAAGRTAAFLLANGSRGEAGRLAVVAATRQYRAHVERELGFQELIQRDHPHLSFAGTLEGQDDSWTNMQMTQSLLEEHPDLCGIYNVGGSSEGIGMALRRTGRMGRVRLIGHGYGPDTRRMLEEGTMMAVLTQRNETLMEVLLDQLHASAPPPPLPMQIIFPTNLPRG